MDESRTFKLAFITNERNLSYKDKMCSIHFMDMFLQLVNYRLKGLFENSEFFKSAVITSGSVVYSPDHDDIKVKISEKAPNLSSLLFSNDGKDSNENVCCFIKGRTLVCQLSCLPINKDLYEEYIVNKLPVFISAVQDIEMLDLPYTVISKINREPNSLSKSKVSHMNPASRPRESPYPMISVNKAVQLVLKETSLLNKEIRPLRDCYSYVLAEDVIATEPYPSFPASVKDGYAVIANDAAFSSNEAAILRIVSTATTGCKPNVIVTPGTCARVSTGGVIPEGADAVVQVEDTRVHDKNEDDEVSIEFLKKPKIHQDIRSIGSDVVAGEVLITAGKKVTPAEIGIMSTCGIKDVSVYKKPLVAVMSTGDEVVEPECSVSPGCIRDCNKNTLCHMLNENRIPFIDVGIAKDNPDDVKACLTLALNKADVVISSGGVSMGEKDVLKDVLEKDFQAIIHFGRVHMKPGKPTTFSTAQFNEEKKLIFSLPGNPVSACVCFYLFVIPCIRKLMGFNEPEHQTIKVKLGHDIKLDERPEFYRVSLSCGSDGVFVGKGTGSQQSSRLLSMQNADALLVLPPKTEELTIMKAGTLVDAILINKSM